MKRITTIPIAIFCESSGCEMPFIPQASLPEGNTHYLFSGKMKNNNMKLYAKLFIAVCCILISTGLFSQPVNWATGGTTITSTSDNILGTTNNYPLLIRTNNTNAGIIDASGKWGIGNTTPKYTLDVTLPGNSFASFGSTLALAGGSYAGIHFGYSEPSNSNYRKSALVFEPVDGAARGKIHLLNNNAYNTASATLADAKLTIDYNGNTGIGTTTPSNITKLDVNGGFRSRRLFYVDRSAGDFQNYFSITVRDAAEGSSFGNALGNGVAEMLTYNTSGLMMGTFNSAPLGFGTTDVERMRITPTGDVGIGITTPASKLHVNGGYTQTSPSYTGTFSVNYTANNSLVFNNSGIGAFMMAGPANIVDFLGQQIKAPTRGAVLGNTTGGNALDVTGTSIFRNTLTADYGITNKRAQLRDDGLYITRSSVGDYGNTILGTDHAMTYGSRSGHFFVVNGTEVLRVSEGRVGIGTIYVADTSYKLFVEKGIRTRKVKVDQAVWPDYVFDKAYHLSPIKELELFIQKNKHLPNVPSAEEVKKEGIDLGDNQRILLEKIEELTLYIIEQNKKIEQLEADKLKVKELAQQLDEIKKALNLKK
jgi:hypothetical protein